MSSYEWQEVKRLAADFQRAQLSSGVQKLSERNWVEIVRKLTKLKLLDIVFSEDGKSYVTPQHLKKEIKDELYVHEGCISMIDVAKILSVDVNIVNSLAQEIVKEEHGIQILLGQLINQTFVTRIAEDISQKIQLRGLVNVADLSRTLGLPIAFIHSVIKDNVGRLVKNVKQDKKDGNIYYSEAFLIRHKCLIHGALLALTKPAQITTIITQCKLDEHVFYTALESLLESKKIPGVLTDRHSNNFTYIPRMYVRLQSEWVRNSYKQNGYLEYSALQRGGISEPKAFISKAITDNGLTYLENCVVGPGIIDQVEAAIDDALVFSSWVDIANILPVTIDERDSSQLLTGVLQIDRFRTTVRIFLDTIVVSESLMNNLNNFIFDQMGNEKIQTYVLSGQYENYMMQCKLNREDSKNVYEPSRREERKKKANVGKSGGGTQGRETKTKSTKKKYGQKSSHKADLDEEEVMYKTESEGAIRLEIISVNEIKGVLTQFPLFKEDEENDCKLLLEELGNYFYIPVNRNAISKARIIYEEYVSSRNASLKKLHSVMQDSLITSFGLVRLYKKGIQHFDKQPDTQEQLSKYLLKNACTDLAHMCFSFASTKTGDVTSAKDRMSILLSMQDKEMKDAFQNLNKALTGNSVEDFLSAVDDVFGVLNIMMKKTDKRKEKTMVEDHKKKLIENLATTDDPAVMLHLACLILFASVTESPLNASGKFVSSIIAFLSNVVPQEMHELLRNYYDNVMKNFSHLKLHHDDDYESVQTLKNLTPQLKHLVVSYKK